MATVLTMANQKGGVGKSTTTQALAAGLTKKGFNVLTVDLDAQGNTSFSLGADRTKATALGVLLGEVTAKEAIQHTQSGDVIPANKSLASLEKIFSEDVKQIGKEYKLREALEEVRSAYDFVLIDTPPALGLATVNALAAADYVIIPAQADIYSIQGIADLNESIKPIKKYCNPALTIGGLLLTRYSARSTFNKELLDLAEEVAGHLNARVYASKIREAVAIRKAQASQQSIYDYAIDATVTEDYEAFINELLDQLKVKEK